MEFLAPALLADPRLILNALDTIPDGIAFFDKDDVLYACNKRFSEIFHAFSYLPSLAGMTFEEIVTHCLSHGEFAGGHVLADPERVLAEFMAKHREPSPKPWNLTLTDGRTIRIGEYRREEGGMVAQYADITDTRRSEMRLLDAIEAVPANFALWDAADRLVLCNERFSSTYTAIGAVLHPGVRYHEFLRRLLEAKAFDFSGSATAFLRRRLELHRQPTSTHEQWLQNGRCFQIQERRTKDGGIVMVEADITTLKTHELELDGNVNELKLVRQELEHQSADMISVLEEAAIAKDRAEEANRAKSTFLATMSHELRTPLNAIIGFSELMMHETFGPVGSDNYAEYVRDIHASGAHLLALINDILDMSRIEAGKASLDIEWVDLPELVVECLHMVEARAANGGIHLVNQLPRSGLTQVRADPKLMRQILLNLLTNAVKFTKPAGTVTISGDLGPTDWALSIDDTGIGIPPEDLSRVLEPFTQIERERGRHHEGTGLGLALTKNLVEMHRGDLTLTSNVGIGTTVRLRFPIGNSAEPMP